MLPIMSRLIADLIDEHGEARCTDIALRLGVANATVVKTLRRLQTAGLVEQEPYRSIFLTMEGWKQAEDGRRRHAVVERFLLALGVSQETAAHRRRRHRAPCERRELSGRWQGSWRSRRRRPLNPFASPPRRNRPCHAGGV